VTLKLVNYERYFTVFNIISLTLLSVGVYVSWTWVADVVPFSNTVGTMMVTYTSPLFYLTVTVTFGFCYVIDFLMATLRFNIWTSPSDYLRLVVHKKGNIQNYKQHFLDIYQKIKEKIRIEDIKHEKILEVRRMKRAEEEQAART
jgi:hypothetical protein